MQMNTRNADRLRKKYALMESKVKKSLKPPTRIFYVEHFFCVLAT